MLESARRRRCRSRPATSSRLEDVLRRFTRRVVRFYLLSTHFRSQIESRGSAWRVRRRPIERLSQRRAAALGEQLAPGLRDGRLDDSRASGADGWPSARRQVSRDAMDDDFNSGAAIGAGLRPDETRQCPPGPASEPSTGSPGRKPSSGCRSKSSTVSWASSAAGFDADRRVPAETSGRDVDRSERPEDKDSAERTIRDRILAAGYLLRRHSAGVRVRRNRTRLRTAPRPKIARQFFSSIDSGLRVRVFYALTLCGGFQFCTRLVPVVSM